MHEQPHTPGLVQIEDERCTFTIRRVRPGTVLIRIRGYDRGDLGTAPLDELVEDLARDAPLELYIDTADAAGATWDVSQRWTAWFQANRARLARVHILVSSRFVRQTIEVARELSRTGNLITIYADRDRFERSLAGRPPGAGGGT